MSDYRPHEPDTVDARRLAWIGVVFAVVFALVLVAMYLLWTPPERSRIAPGSIPPTPRLEQLPRDELITVTQQQQRQMQAYGWNDETHRFAHIPVRRAMAIMVQRAGASSSRGDRP